MYIYVYINSMSAVTTYLLKKNYCSSVATWLTFVKKLCQKLRQMTTF